MKFLRGFVSFWYQLIIGDDWRIAAGVAVALAFGALLAANDILGGSALAVLVGALIFAGFVANVVATGLRGDA